MAFVNDLLEDDEIREYDVSEYKVFKPGAGTIDREKNLKLFYTGHPHEDMVQRFFLFVWDEKKIRVTMSRILGDDCVIWRLNAISIPRECGLGKEDVLEELRNAFRVYGLSGYSIVKYDPVKVEIEF